MSKLLEALYIKVFVNIIVHDKKVNVYIESCSKKEVLDSTDGEFDISEGFGKLNYFIQNYTKESPFHYISYIDNSLSQGAIPLKVKKEEFFDVESSVFKNFNQNWLYYTSKSDLNLLQKEYKDIGVDFIFSPFVILARFFKEKIESSNAMFILVEDNYVSLCVFENDELLYAEHIGLVENKNTTTTKSQDDDELDEFELDDVSIDLEDISVEEEEEELDEMIEELGDEDDIENLDDLSDIADLDSIEDIEEFTETQEEGENFLDDQKDMNPLALNHNYKIFSKIQSSINNYYHDDKYDSKFIESAYIADSVGDANDLKHYLEEEMFLSAYVRRIDLAAEICEVAKVEVK